MGKTVVRKLPVSLTELEAAPDNASYELSYVLDLETGEVLVTVSDEGREVGEIYAEIGEAEGDEWAAFEAALERRDMSERRPERAPQKEAVRQAARIEAEFGTRYRRVGPEDPHAAYRDREAFIDTVEGTTLESRLERAISGRGAFRYFRGVLQDFPAERERWYAFKSARQPERVLAWLRAEDIEPLAE